MLRSLIRAPGKINIHLILCCRDCRPNCSLAGRRPKTSTSPHPLFFVVVCFSVVSKREMYVFISLTLWLTAQCRPFFFSFQKCPFQLTDPIAYSSLWEIQYSGLCFAPCIDPHSTRSLLSNLFPPPYRSCEACSVFNNGSTLKQFRWQKKIPNLKL